MARLKAVVDVADAMLEDVGEADEDRQADAAELQPIDQLLEVDRPASRPSSDGPGRDQPALIEK